MYPHGPFRSIYELEQVVDLRNPLGNTAAQGGVVAFFPAGSGYPPGTLPGVANGYWTLPLPNTRAVTPDDSLSELRPAGQDRLPTVAPVTVTTWPQRGDFGHRFLTLNRISNLITTRSDSFTCYILVQGWRDVEPAGANSPQPSLVVQRRVGIIVDRSRVTADPVSTGKITKQAFFNN
jgi:hypothetical protein